MFPFDANPVGEHCLARRFLFLRRSAFASSPRSDWARNPTRAKTAKAKMCAGNARTVRRGQLLGGLGVPTIGNRLFLLLGTVLRDGAP